MILDKPIDYKLCSKNMEITKYVGSNSLYCFNKQTKESYRKTAQKQVKIDDYINEECNLVKQDEFDKLKEAEKTVSKQKSTKKKFVSLLFLIVNIVVIFVLLFTQSSSAEGLPTLSEVFSGENFSIGFLFLILGLFAVYMGLEALKYFTLLKRSDYRSRFFLCYKTAALGRYYDAITPLATGGQPFQVYYLNKRGVSPSKAVSLPLGKYVFNQITFVLFCLFVVIFGSKFLQTDTVSSTIVTSAAWIGLSLNAFLILLVLWLSISKKIGSKIVVGILKLLQKMRIVKNYQKQYQRVMKLVSDYQATMRYYASNVFIFLLNIFINLASLVIYYSIPFLIYCLFNGYAPQLYLQIFFKVVLIDLAVSFVPLPGGAGTAELSFKSLFSSLFVNGTLFYAMLIWRIFSYYSFLLQGLGVLIYDYAKGNKVYSWHKIKWRLQDEGKERIDNLLSTD